MTGISGGLARAIAAAFPWARAGSFVDVGCAQGGATVAIAAAHPHLAAIGFDLPLVGPVFDEYVHAHGLDGRVRFQPGDFFQGPLPVADVIVMGHVLHDWNLEQKHLLLQKAYAALPKRGALIVYDAMIDDARSRNAAGLLMSLNMLIETPGGFDYTPSDCRSWLKATGFGSVRLVPLTASESMLIATKPGH